MKKLLQGGFWCGYDVPYSSKFEDYNRHIVNCKILVYCSKVDDAPPRLQLTTVAPGL